MDRLILSFQLYSHCLQCGNGHLRGLGGNATTQKDAGKVIKFEVYNLRYDFFIYVLKSNIQ